MLYEDKANQLSVLRHSPAKDNSFNRGMLDVPCVGRKLSSKCLILGCLSP